MIRFMAAFAALLVALAQPATAQETARAKAGEEVRVGWIGSVGENCQARPAPSVKPSSVAGHGQIKLMKGTVKTDTIASCPGMEIPAVVVFYKSSPDFKGTDSFALSSPSGPERTYTIEVE
jgi:hypothetical protein